MVGCGIAIVDEDHETVVCSDVAYVISTPIVSVPSTSSSSSNSLRSLLDKRRLMVTDELPGVKVCLKGVTKSSKVGVVMAVYMSDSVAQRYSMYVCLNCSYCY